MYWCAASCEDDDPDLKEAKWLSITNHIMNKHTGHKNPLFPNCLHGRLHGRERKKSGLSQVRNISTTSARVLSGVPNTKTQMKAQGRFGRVLLLFRGVWNP